MLYLRWYVTQFFYGWIWFLFFIDLQKFSVCSLWSVLINSACFLFTAVLFGPSCKGRLVRKFFPFLLFLLPIWQRQSTEGSYRADNDDTQSWKCPKCDHHHLYFFVTGLLGEGHCSPLNLLFVANTGLYVVVSRPRQFTSLKFVVYGRMSLTRRRHWNAKKTQLLNFDRLLMRVEMKIMHWG